MILYIFFFRDSTKSGLKYFSYFFEISPNVLFFTSYTVYYILWNAKTELNQKLILSSNLKNISNFQIMDGLFSIFSGAEAQPLVSCCTFFSNCECQSKSLLVYCNVKHLSFIPILLLHYLLDITQIAYVFASIHVCLFFNENLSDVWNGSMFICWKKNW